MVRSLSKGLNSTINQILRLYEANLFIERPIYRVIFGSSEGSSEDNGGSPVPTMPEMPLDGDDSTSASNNSIGLARLQTASEGAKSGISDRATLEILKLYDKTSQYFEKLGVDVNPYDLVAAQLNGKEGGSLNSKLQDSEGSVQKKYRFNSMLAFFQNNSLQKFDLSTGKDMDEKKKQKNGQLIRLNNERYA